MTNEKLKVGVGVGVMVLSDGKILLGKRHEDSDMASSKLKGAGTWTMPGGKLDFGETIEECAIRETLEETNIKVDDVEVICLNQDIIETAHFITIGLLAKSFSGEVETMEPNTITEWGWFDLDDLPEPLYFPTVKVLENYKQGKFYIH